MPRRAAGLTAAGMRTAKPGRHGDGNGLYLLVRPNGTRFWLFRWVRKKRMREMGLGRAGDGRAEVGLAAARDLAAGLMLMVKAGTDPLAQREADAAAEVAAAQAAAIRGKTFRQVADAYISANEAGWRNPKHRQQWRNTIDSYALPVCGDLPVADVATEHVMSILEPIWRVKPETASRLRGRIEAVIDYASAREWRTGDNPARWRGHVANMLPSRNKVARPGHHAALPWAQMAGFMAALCAQGGVGSLALQFAILTAARTGEVMGARWSEVDLTEAVWNVPGERMKAGRPHRVPLSGPAIAVLRALAPLRVSSRDTDAYVFPGRRRGRPLSSMAMLMLLRRMGRGDLTAHGFRSTFRDWCAEATTHEGAVAEAALAHTVRDKVEAAYRRGDQFEKRRRLMAEWASFCAQPAEKLVDGTPI
jgi:integrase